MILRVVLFMLLTVSQASGQTPGWSPYPPLWGPGHIDRPAVPLDQAAAVIVVLVPDESYDGGCGGPHDCSVRGSVVRLDKGPLPGQIVRTAHSLGNPLKAGQPITLYLTRFPDRDVYYIIGSHPMPAGPAGSN